MTELSVIIPTLKPEDEIESLRRLERLAFDDYEVIVRDDDRATTARNEGIERAESDKLVFLDDDSLPAEGYLERAAELLDREAAVAGRVVHPRDDVVKRFTGHYALADSAKYVSRFWGCNMLVRREVFEDVGMWDEEITWGHEEKELAERVLHEYPIYYDPDLLVYHAYADSIVDLWRKAYRMERQTPHYWDRVGRPRSQQWVDTVRLLLDPFKYVGYSAPHTVARAGRTVARVAGRTSGLLDSASTGGGRRRDLPFF
ncbi:glycosyltransferase family 2 protein [Salinigranum halophilum]|jgi:GT2 family glycosyltransferase|uniref:glycosyltransferase family 2 protein n=1 Tax=Salinigranum halophilum TaxID=2565931 RepID=UPI00115F08E0|nr:glycosyltransferase [Salinigranum halophilum]